MSCSGECCVAFPLSGLDYAELERRYHRVRDGATIFDMVRPLTRAQAADRLVRFNSQVPAEGSPPLYRCVRWDEQTRLCTRYDERPELCRDYPYEGSCDHPACDHQEPLITRIRWLAVRLGVVWWHTRNGLHFGTPGIPALTFPG